VRVYQFRHIRAERQCSRVRFSLLRRGLLICAAIAAACTLGGAAAAPRLTRGSTEVVVTLPRAPLAEAKGSGAAIAADQARLERRIVHTIPSARIRWRYRHVLDAVAVVLPARDIGRLSQIDGVEEVYPSVRYSPALDESPGLINAPALWGSDLAGAGQGIKIGIVDDGVDQAHAFFNAAGFAAPPGYPRGNLAYTTAKVIVARAFPPPTTTWKYAARPFDPQYSVHATHVAGIAAGDYNATQRNNRPVSGVAPRAYIGNYKVLTVPTPDVGLDGNSPEIVKGIDAAVADGMNVINLSLGEPEVDLGRDIVVKAIDAAADAGVIPVIAAGNDFDEFGYGSVASPGDAPKALTVAAVTKDDVIADFSSSGPSGIDLGFKPELSAPGVSIFSSVPSGWDVFSGTSMASPHVAGGAALLLQRHPGWTPAQIKSALVLTGRPVWADDTHARETLATREGGGLIDLAAANNPLLFADPASVSLGFLRPGAVVARTVRMTDAGGGAGVWTASLQIQQGVGNVKVGVPSGVAVPGTFTLSATQSGTSEGDVTGFVVLHRGTVTRRIPFWLRATMPYLARHRRGRLRRPGVYRGTTRAKAARVDCYRYPADPTPVGVARCLRGPEQVFRVRLAGPAANFGVVVLSHGRGVRVSPRVVRAGDENRLTGYAGLPLDLNPYRSNLDRPTPVAGAERPTAGFYDVVFDTPSRRYAGAYTFRFWIGDTKPPRVRLLTRTVTDNDIRFRVTDRGSGVDPRTLSATIDGDGVPVRYRNGIGRISIGYVTGSGRHTITLRVSDYQEAKNMENTGPILPNTTRFRGTFVSR
jgi:subtilisin family serine protease